MSPIVRLFLATALTFCLTIPVVYAEEQSLTMPALVIDLSPVAAGIYQQLAQLWLALALAGGMLALLVFIALNWRRGGAPNTGDSQARSVSLVWLVFLVLMVLGLALPLVRMLQVLLPAVSVS